MRFFLIFCVGVSRRYLYKLLNRETLKLFIVPVTLLGATASPCLELGTPVWKRVRKVLLFCLSTLLGLSQVPASGGDHIPPPYTSFSYALLIILTFIFWSTKLCIAARWMPQTGHLCWTPWTSARGPTERHNHVDIKNSRQHKNITVDSRTNSISIAISKH